MGRDLLDAAAIVAEGDVDTFVGSVTAGLGETDALEADLRAFARQHVRAVVQRQAVQLRRLVIGEAGRCPGPSPHGARKCSVISRTSSSG